MKVKILVLLMFVGVIGSLLFLAACSDPDDSIVLKILSLIGNPEHLGLERQSILKATIDYDGDGNPYYAWQTPDGGTVHSMSDSAIFTAPDTAGLYGIVLEVSEGGVSDIDTIYLLVDADGTGYFDFLMIDSLVATLDTIPVSTTTVLKVFYTYDGDESIEYDWGGSGSFSAGEDSVVWTAPVSGRDYTITASLVAGELSDVADITITVTDSLPLVHLEITSLVAPADSVQRGGEIEIHSEVEYNRERYLTYDWTVTAGEITDGSDVVFTAPDSLCTVIITMIVDEVFGDKADTASLDLRVVEIDFEDTLDIRTINLTPATIAVNDTATITADVYYNGLGTVDLTWGIDEGTLIGDSEVVTWVAPSSPGEYYLSLDVTDGFLSDSAIVQIDVMHSLSLTDIIVVPESVGVGLETNLLAEFVYTGSGELSWEWFISVGMILGATEEAVFTAPTSPTSIKVGVILTDGELADTLEKTIRSFTPPVDTLGILSMDASPDSIIVIPGETGYSFVSAVVNYTGTGLVTHTWSSSAGTTSGGVLSTRFEPPVEYGIYWVYLEVEIEDLYDIDSVRVDFWPELEDSLIITSFLPNPSVIGLGGTSEIRSEVYYTGDASLDYTWGSVGGELTTSASPDTAFFTADTEGEFPIRLIVTDGAIADTVADSVRVLDFSVDTLFIESFTAIPDTVLEGETVNFIADIGYTGDDALLRYFWQFDTTEGFIESDLITASWTAPFVGGDYSAWFAVTDDSLADTSQVDIFVIELDDSLILNEIFLESGNLFVGGELTLCADFIYTGEGELAFIWDAEVSWITGDTCAIWDIPPDSGTYSIHLEITDGVYSVEDTIFLHIIDPGFIQIDSLIASSYHVLSLDTVRFEVFSSYSGPHIVEHSWEVFEGGGAILEYEDFRRVMYLVAPTWGGTSVIMVEASDGVIADTQYVSIYVTETIDSLIIYNVSHAPDTGLPGIPVEITADIRTVGGSPDIEWSAADGFISPTDDATMFWTPPSEFGTYPINLSVDYLDMHEDTTIHIIVYDRAADTLQIEHIGPFDIFTGENVVLAPSIHYNRGGTLEYTWSRTGGRFFGSETSSSINWICYAPDSGDFQVRLDVTDGFISDSVIIDIFATVLRYPNRLITSPEVSVLEVGESITLMTTVLDNLGDTIPDPELSYFVSCDPPGTIELDEVTGVVTAMDSSIYQAVIYTSLVEEPSLRDNSSFYVWNDIPDTLIAIPDSAITNIDATARIALTLLSDEMDTVAFAPWMEIDWSAECETYAEIDFNLETRFLEFDGLREGACILDFALKMPARDSLYLFIPLTVTDEPVFVPVAGQVQNEAGEPIENARVTLESGIPTPMYLYEWTDEFGNFSFDSIVTGTRGIQIEKEGYDVLDETIYVVSPGIVDVIFILED